VGEGSRAWQQLCSVPDSKPGVTASLARDVPLAKRPVKRNVKLGLCPEARAGENCALRLFVRHSQVNKYVLASGSGRGPEMEVIFFFFFSFFLCLKFLGCYFRRK